MIQNPKINTHNNSFSLNPLRSGGAKITIVILAFVAISCHKEKTEDPKDEDILVTVNDSSLRLSDVIMDIPIGLSEVDSTRLFHAIVNSWVDDRLLESVAEENIDDIDKIEALVTDYRRKLITEAYKRKIRQTTPLKVSEDSLKKYYQSHLEELRLEAPLLKGIYIKIPQHSTGISDLKRWMASAHPDDIDKIEKIGLGDAVQYDYFLDRWVEFSSIAEQIPYRFYDPDAFLKSTSDFETSYAGYDYILHVDEYIPTGDFMPFEYAKRVISDRLSNEKFLSYEHRLIAELRKEAKNEGCLKTPGYDLNKRRVTLTNNR